MFKVMGKKIITIYAKKNGLSRLMNPHLFFCTLHVVDKSRDLLKHHVGEIMPRELVKRLLFQRDHYPTCQQPLVQTMEEC